MLVVDPSAFYQKPSPKISRSPPGLPLAWFKQDCTVPTKLSEFSCPKKTFLGNENGLLLKGEKPSL